MKTRVAAVVAAVMLGATAPVSSALAFSAAAPVERTAPVTRFAPEVTGSLGVHDDPKFTRCPTSSAAEGNANQQHFPVKQYGQTSGGTRC
ncbi:hypothetical protein [Methylorubrum salsuginis]|uniref:Uncharacterized protein n=1 Tax=Methylorubrum salsuginis TaxID=414703 RepID=A0A1I4BGD2_9HYPH|nr:hypothetical protein [Methylorubrum salsuginis]SFK67553.1 hypothetical protein SAMN04488125_103184 [Methylorubrum salsuginis]